MASSLVTTEKQTAPPQVSLSLLPCSRLSYLLGFDTFTSDDGSRCAVSSPLCPPPYGTKAQSLAQALTPGPGESLSSAREGRKVTSDPELMGTGVRLGLACDLLVTTNDPPTPTRMMLPAGSLLLYREETAKSHGVALSHMQTPTTIGNVGISIVGVGGSLVVTSRSQARPRRTPVPMSSGSEVTFLPSLAEERDSPGPGVGAWASD